MAAAEGVGLMAITDHDSVAGLEEGEAAAKAAGIAFVPGIEISVKGGHEMHILGYCVERSDPRLVQASAEFARLREEREGRIVVFLAKQGIPITHEAVRRHVKGKVTGRAHFARAIVDAGFAANTGEAFRRYLDIPEFKSVDRPKPSPEHGIALIRGAGGVPVLAHPNTLRMDSAELDAALAELAGLGLQGLECHYSTNSGGQTRLYLALAHKYGLLVTGGSDFHGEDVKKGVEIGSGINGSLKFDGLGVEERLWALAAGNRQA